MGTLVTGGAGFIGSHLVAALLDRGERVTVLDSFDPYYDPARKERNLAALLPGIQLIRADLCDAQALERALDGVDVVIHLAARAGVRASIEDPRPYMRANVEGTAALLQAMSQRPGTRLVNASSSSVYGARNDGPFRESDPLSVAASPYAASKHASELLCDTWHRLHGLPIITLRFFTVYGPRQRPDMALYRFLRAILDNRPITLYGDGSSMRDYTYVQDTVRGILAAVDCPLPSAVFNLGNSKPVTLRELVETLARVLGREPEIRWAPEQPGDVPLTWADTGRAKSILGFECACSLHEGLAHFVEWMQVEELAGHQGLR